MTVDEEAGSLAARVKALECQVAILAGKIAELEGGQASPFGRLASAPRAELERQDAMLEGAAGVSEEALTWAGRASLLPRLATLCFLLVVALLLRTIAETGLVSAFAGNFLGMGYAAALMAAGWILYARKSALAPVFAAAGAVLMSSVVVETHSSFQTLPLVPAYLTLMGTALFLALASHRFNAFMPISVGLLATCLGAAAMDWPRPNFPLLSLVLFAANLLGYSAAQLKRCSWLRWSILGVTIFMLGYWGILLGQSAAKAGMPAASLFPLWYLPIVAAYFLSFLSLALLGTFRASVTRISRFDISLPPIDALWASTAGLLAVLPLGRAWTLALGALLLLLSLAHFALVFFAARRRGGGDPSLVSFAIAGAVLLAFAVPALLGSFILSLPFLALLALLLGPLSKRWQNEGLRGVAYFVQVFAALGSAIAVLAAEDQAATLPAILAVFLVAVLAIGQFAWVRRSPPSVEGSIFTRFDPKDRGAVLILLSGMLAAYVGVRLVLALAVAGLSGEGRADVFSCAQSVFINLVVIALLLLAWRRSDRELRNVAILLTLVGIVKVFLFDLLEAHGVPLVVSVFSFGLAASLESVVLGRWKRDGSNRDAPPPMELGGKYD